MTTISRDIGRTYPWTALPVEVSAGAGLAALVGLVTIIAVALGMPWLTSIIPSHVPVAANTGLCFLLLAAALSASYLGRRAASIPAALVVLTAGLTAFQFLTGRDIGVDRWLLGAPPGASSMSPQTAVAFLVLSLGILAARTVIGAVIIRVATTAVLLLAAINLLDVLYGAKQPTVLAGYTQMALPTAATMMVLAIAVDALRPDGGFLHVVRWGGLAGALTRRLLAAAIVIPVAVGWLRLWGERAGWYESAFGVALTSLSSVILFIVVVGLTARTVQRSEAAREVAEMERERARAEAEAANVAKGEFLSRMSHELRTPLNSVLGFAQLLDGDELGAEQRESVAYIRRAGSHLLDLINEVLDLARVDSGSLTISVEAVAVGECIEEAGSFVIPLAAARDIAVEIQSVDAAGGFVLADRQRLRQVLLNLLSNAVKYNRHGGRITVTCDEVTGGRVRIAVADTGPGIPVASHHRLFEPFDRLGAEATQIEGSGMGLALSKRLVEAMGGEIGVESAPGSGSTFWITFPSTSAPEDAMPATASPALPVDHDGAQRDVLYIEDNPANLRLVERIVARMSGVRLLTAMQGAIGLELARELRPDLILLDLHLPDMDGSAVLDQLRADPRTADVPVVVLTADGSERRAATLLAAGADAYLTKPLDVEEFGRVVDGFLVAAAGSGHR